MAYSNYSDICSLYHSYYSNPKLYIHFSPMFEESSNCVYALIQVGMVGDCKYRTGISI